MPGYRESMVDALLDHAVERPGSTAVVDTGGERLSYEELFACASQAARILVDGYGVGPGAKVAIGLENTVASAVVLFGVWLAGGTAVVIDPLSFEEDLRMQFEQSRPVLVMGDEQGFERLCGVARSMGLRCASVQEVYGGARGGGVWEGYVRPRAWMDAIVYFYAGIAGRTLETFHAHSGVAASAAITVEHFGLSGDSVYVTPPLSHALGLQIGFLSALWAGGTAILLRRRGRLDPRAVAEHMVALRPAMVIGAPMLYSSLLDAGYRGHEGLRIAVSAGAPLPVEVQRRWRASTGVELLQLYGMTEAAPVSATKPGDNPEASIGRPMPGVEIRVVDPEDPERDAAGGVGELLVRGPMVMRGYGDPGETERAFHRGWLRTGDLVELRDGHLYFRGVRKRMLKYKGYPIFPRDLELLLERHPAVERAEVYGEPAGDLGQVPVARVWLRAGASVSVEELLEWVNKRVAPYKRLRRIEVVG